MYQRSGGTHAQYTVDEDDYCHERHGLAEAQHLIDSTGNVDVVTNRVRGGVTKKLLLWLVLVLQICFIGCFWLLQLGFSASVGGWSAANAISGTAAGGRGRGLPIVESSGRVNFIKMDAVAALKMQTKPPKEVSEGKQFKIPTLEENVSNFAKDFYLKPNRLNRTVDEQEEIAPPYEAPQLWCFRAGTHNETATKRQEDAEAEADLLLWDPEERCSCEPDWHGRDCGQPEVMWRALMMARRPFELQIPHSNSAHRLVHMLEGNFHSLDMLELQIKSVIEVVDYFIVYMRNAKVKLRDLKALEHRLRETLSRRNYFVFHCGGRLRTKATDNCTATHAYHQFREAAGRSFKASDLFLYTNDREILAPHALTFLKYYASDVRLVRFRMKYTVYGFYWQHPLRTHLTAVISSLVHLDSPALGNADPMLLLRLATETGISSTSPSLIIGDLNHVGGWYCKYCLQPDEIIDELHAESQSVNDSKPQLRGDVQFPNTTRTHHIDAAYLRSLIATGLYVDGRTPLTKLRRYSDRYYAPVYAEANSWKFGNLLVNLYESLEEDIEDEEAAVY